MPLFSDKSGLNSSASGSQLAFADIDLIKGAFKVYPNITKIRNESVNYFSDKQIVMTGDTGQLYQATVVLADYISIFEDSASFAEFQFAGSGGGSTPDGTISGSQQISDLGFITSDDTSSFVLVDDSSSFFQSMSFDDSTNLLSIEGGNSVDLSPLTGSGGGSGTGIFALTGSVYSTTNDLQITGSFTVGDGLFRLKEFTTTPNAEEGAIYYSASNFYFGVE